MVISYQSGDAVSIKAKNETLVVGDGVRIGSHLINSAGEYDVKGIQCEAHNLSKAVAYFIRAEDLVVTFLSEPDKGVTNLDDASKTDILIVDVRSDSTSDEVKTIVKALEPGYLILVGSGATTEFNEGLGLPKFDGTQLKVTRTSLPMEGTQILPRS